MKTPATTDAYFVLSDEYTGQPQADSPALLFPFPRLIADMQMAITEQLDMPTRCSFSWTCREYHARYGDENFDCFAFADKCAELGFRALLLYSVERGGPFDDKTCFVAAANGRVNILQLHVRLKQNNALKVDFEVINVVRFWAEYAARMGYRKVLSWLRVEQWTNYYTLCGIVEAAIEKRQTDLALDLYNRAMHIAPARRASGWENLLGRAAMNGHVEFAQKLLQNPPEDRRIDWVDLLKKSLIFREDNASFVQWCFEQNLVVLTEERKKTIIDKGKLSVSFLQLAEKLGVEFTVEQFDPVVHQCQLPPMAVLKYLHERFSLPNGHFQAAYVFSGRESKDDFHWLQEHGYTVRFAAWVIKDLIRLKKLDTLSLAWVLQRGVRPDTDDIEAVALSCKIELLDRLWAVKADFVALDANLLKKLLATWCEPRNVDPRNPPRFRFRAMLKTLQWVQDHGCTFDSSMTRDCDAFINLIRHTRPKFLKDYYDEIVALNMPLSPETLDFLENIKNKKP